MAGDGCFQCSLMVYAILVVGCGIGGAVMAATYSSWRFWYESLCTVVSTGIRYRCSCDKDSCSDCLDVYYSAKVIATGQVFPKSMETLASPFPNRTIGMTFGCLSDGIGKNCTTTVSTVADATYYYNVGAGLLIAFAVIISPVVFFCAYALCCDGGDCKLRDCDINCGGCDSCGCQEFMANWKRTRRERRERRRREREERIARRRNGNDTGYNPDGNSTNNGSSDYNITAMNSTNNDNTYNYQNIDSTNPNNSISMATRNEGDPAADAVYAKVLGDESARRQNPDTIIDAIPVAENSAITSNDIPVPSRAANNQENARNNNNNLPPVASIALT